MPGNGELKVSRSTAELKEDIERAREQIATSANALREEVAAKTDWREWVRQRPGLAIAGAIALGVFLGTRE